MLRLTFRSLNRNIAYGILQDRIKRKSVIQEMPIPQIPRETFDNESFSMLVKLKTAFKQLQKIDSQITEIRLNMDRLQVESAVGSWLFQRDLDQITLYFTSPISGVYKYYYDVQQKRWISNKDLHIFEDNLVRQTSKYFKGYLEL